MGHREATIDTAAIEEATAIVVAGAYWGHKASTTVIEVATASSSYWDQKQEVANTAARVAC